MLTNNTGAVSGTGQGEFLISHFVGHTIAMLIELKGLSLQDACEHKVIHLLEISPKERWE